MREVGHIFQHGATDCERASSADPGESPGKDLAPARRIIEISHTSGALLCRGSALGLGGL